MRKKFLMRITLLMLLASLLFPTHLINASEFELALGHHLTTTHFAHEITEKFAERVDELTDGRVKIEIYPGTAIGDQRELIDGMATGGVDMSINDPGYLSTLVPELGIFDLPFMWEDYEHLERAYVSNSGRALQDLLREQVNIRSLSFYHAGFRNIYLVEEIESYKDLEGLSIRSPEAPVYVRTIEALGASAETIPWADLITGLQTGMVDGLEGEPTAMYTEGIHELTDYVLETGHIFVALSLNISELTFMELPEDIQDKLIQAAEEIQEWAHQHVKDTQERNYANVLEGVEPVPITDSEREEILDLVSHIHDDYVEETGAIEFYNEFVELGQ